MPQSWNRYTYVLNNPLKFVDPDGLRWVQRSLSNGGTEYGWCATDDCYNSTIDSKAEGYQGWTAVTFDESQSFGYVISGSGGDLYDSYTLNPDGTHGCNSCGSVDMMPGQVLEAAVGGVAGKALFNILGRVLGPVAASIFGRAAGEVAEEAAESGVQLVGRQSTVQANKAAGDAFRDEVGDLMRSAGRDVEFEVYKRTPFGPRRIDIEVSNQGQVLGGIETKVGGSRYLPSQRAKDQYLRTFENYPVNVVRKP